MYTISAAAARAGISVPLARAWERRYGVVSPTRTAAGYRIYDEAAVARLSAMRELIARGWTAGAAATSLREMDDGAVRALATNPIPAGSAGPSLEPGERLVAAFVRAATALDASAIEEVLDDAFARGSFEWVSERFLLPMMVAVGDAWQSGRLHIAGEHLASHAVQRRLATAFEAAGRTPAHARPVLVGLPPGSRHELGALGFATGARRAGMDVTYLGPDLPIEDWRAAARAADARAAVIGVATERDAAPAAALAAALRADRPAMLVAVGGPAAGQAASDGVLELADGIGSAVDVVRRALDATR
jgi:DNA-binding transcriptional MerR regulator